MGKHSEWRKLAKKLRRKRIRQAKARERDNKLSEEQQRIESSPYYKKWLQEQERIEQEKAREEEIQAALREEQWRKVEEEAQRQWRELQKKIALAREEKMKQNMKIKLEWEKEQQRLKEIQKAKEKELEEKRIQQEKREKELLDFLEQGGDTPQHLKTKMETNPGKQTCPFFQKVSACRFFDGCSRNHVRPGISRALLITNFFSDLSLEVKENEHGSDTSLEFEKEDTYKHYKEFFYDVVLELEKCGKIKYFITCCNHEQHLRGNVYVQYNGTREALVSYHKFNGRWYGGRQLNVEFCGVENWKSAICGLFFRNKCPKGNACNFLHIFRNPQGLYMYSEQDSARENRINGSRRRERTSRRKRDDFDDSSDYESSERRHWRWSESPERFPRQYSSDEEEHRKDNSRRHRSDTKETPSGKNRRRRNRSRSKSRRRSKTRKDEKRSCSSKKGRRRSRSSSRKKHRSSCSQSSDSSSGT